MASLVFSEKPRRLFSLRNTSVYVGLKILLSIGFTSGHESEKVENRRRYR